MRSWWRRRTSGISASAAASPRPCSISSSDRTDPPMAAGPCASSRLKAARAPGNPPRSRLLAEPCVQAGELVEVDARTRRDQGAEEIRSTAGRRWRRPLAAGERSTAAFRRPGRTSRACHPPGALRAGKWVLCDRFADSTLAYQGYGQGLDLDWLWTLRRHIVGATEPGLDHHARSAGREAAWRAPRPNSAMNAWASISTGAWRTASGSWRRPITDRCRIVDAARDREAIAADISRLDRSNASASASDP